MMDYYSESKMVSMTLKVQMMAHSMDFPMEKLKANMMKELEVQTETKMDENMEL